MTGGLEVQGQPWLHSKFHISLGYLKLSQESKEGQSMVVHTFNASIQESEVGGLPRLHSETQFQEIKQWREKRNGLKSRSSMKRLSSMCEVVDSVPVLCKTSVSLVMFPALVLFPRIVKGVS